MDTIDKKGEVLKAASSCFARYGYEKTTMDDIGRLVGLNKASLYYYYKNKESLYTEVIFFEANAFMTKVFAEVDRVPSCKDKVTTYLKERYDYIKNALNLNQLSIGSVQKLVPLFEEMYNKIIQKETEYLSVIFEQCIKNKEITPCDTKRISKNIITISDAIKNRIDSCTGASVSDYKHIEAVEEIIYTTSLILDGLIIR